MSAIEWCAVPGGGFRMGSDVRVAHPPEPDEGPRHTVVLDAFRLAREPVSNAAYAAFVAASGHPPPCSWPDGRCPPGAERVPVTYVSWDDAQAFCAWVGGRLPTEAEWEAAATAGDGRLWPWGDLLPAPARAVLERGIGGPAPLGGRSAGAAPCGALDLAGNVLEWTSSVYRSYPHDPRDGRDAPSLPGPRVARGGAFIHGAAAARCTARHPLGRWATDPYVGFRPAAAAGEGSDDGPVDWLDVAGGAVLVGRDPEGEPFDEALPDELPAHHVELDPFGLARTPVTNAQYAVFTRATGHPPPPHWPDGGPAAAPDVPVTWVDWHDARAFAVWAGGRLPTEAEWERAARGAERRRFPWGWDESAEGHALVGLGSRRGAPGDVTQRPLGAAACGALDLGGNVWEWLSSLYRPYPYAATDGREDSDAPGERVLRGGSYASPGLRWARSAFRSRSHPGRRQAHIGFRIARGGDQ